MILNLRRQNRLLDSVAFQFKHCLTPKVTHNSSSVLIKILKWFGVILVPVIAGTIVIQVRALIDPLTPLVQSKLNSHPGIQWILVLLVGMGPDIATLSVAILGLTYLIPRIVKQIEQSISKRLVFLGIILCVCLGSIIANQLSRERLDNWQAMIGGKVQHIDNKDTVTPTWLDTWLKERGLPNRLSSNQSPPSAQDKPTTPNSSQSSKPDQHFTQEEVGLLKMSATFLANQIQHDFDAGMAKEQAIDKELIENTAQGYIDSGISKEQAQTMADSMRHGSTWSARMEEEVRNSAGSAIHTHRAEIDVLISLGRSNQLNPQRDLVSRMLTLEYNCSINAVREVSQCVDNLNQVAVLAR